MLSVLPVLSFKNKTKPPLMVLEDNKDNNNNRKNGRNIGCHEVTYNTDNRYYLCLLRISARQFSRQHSPLSSLSVLSLKKSVISVLYVSSVGQPVRLY